MTQKEICAISFIALTATASSRSRLNEDGESRADLFRRKRPQKSRLRYLASLLLFSLVGPSILAQEKSPEPLKGVNRNIAAMTQGQPQTPSPSAKRSITLTDAVSIFLQQNLQLVAARYDVDS